MKRILLITSLVVCLSGCAQAARVDQMSAAPMGALPDASPLKHSVQVDNVSGGTSTNPMWLSKVGNSEFQAALQSSLAGAGMISGGPSRYHLNATLQSLDQPMIGFDLTVSSRVHYVLTDSTTNASAFDNMVAASYTATMSDAFIAVERLRIANEGSIRKNIQTFMDKLIADFGKRPAISLLSAPPTSGTVDLPTERGAPQKR